MKSEVPRYPHFPAHVGAHYWLHWWDTSFGLSLWRVILEPDGSKSILTALRRSASVRGLCSRNVSQRNWHFRDSPLRPWREGRDGYFLLRSLNRWLSRGFQNSDGAWNKAEMYIVIKCTFITDLPSFFLRSLNFLLLSFPEIPIQRDGGHILPGSQQINLSYFP